MRSWMLSSDLSRKMIQSRQNRDECIYQEWVQNNFPALEHVYVSEIPTNVKFGDWCRYVYINTSARLRRSGGTR